ncbi:hypothetical protein WG70_21645 [Burkholderia oklahomensis EO147]|nr:hypothetical protein WG70_21645 [Burkholderia oklahomensis EO147]KUY55754.1 hypothetical protein WG70_10835 [Burkholderia oklahomensis EO147]KUY55767.1 hypothetical protein WG70_10925 [Burkholderia oklahomensis EO147]
MWTIESDRCDRAQRPCAASVMAGRVQPSKKRSASASLEGDGGRDQPRVAQPESAQTTRGTIRRAANTNEKAATRIHRINPG